MCNQGPPHIPGNCPPSPFLDEAVKHVEKELKALEFPPMSELKARVVTPPRTPEYVHNNVELHHEEAEEMHDAEASPADSDLLDGLQGVVKAKIEEYDLSKPYEPPTETARCTGHCCRRFTLPYSPARLWEMYTDWQRTFDGSRYLIANHNDIHLVAPMLIPLDEGKPTMVDVNGDPLAASILKADNLYAYTCKHFDNTAGNCLIYEHRPRMCSDYPYGHICGYKDCTRRMSNDPSHEKLVQLRSKKGANFDE